MELMQLAEEYRTTADRLEKRLSQLKIALQTALGEDAFSLQRRIELLYAELSDVRKIMGYLKQYYN